MEICPSSSIIAIRMNKESRVTLACLYGSSGRFYMLQLISVDSRHCHKKTLWQYTKRMWVCPGTTIVGKDHGQSLIESALHSFYRSIGAKLEERFKHIGKNMSEGLQLGLVRFGYLLLMAFGHNSYVSQNIYSQGHES